MNKMADALLVAGLVTRKARDKTCKEQERKDWINLQTLRVQSALARGDMRSYMRERAKLPVELRSRY